MFCDGAELRDGSGKGTVSSFAYLAYTCQQKVTGGDVSTVTPEQAASTECSFQAFNGQKEKEPCGSHIVGHGIVRYSCPAAKDAVDDTRCSYFVRLQFNNTIIR